LMSRSMNLPAIQKVLMEFEKESEVMDMKETMMSEAVDDVMDDEAEEEEEGDRILKEVLDEIGVSVGHQLGDAPPTSLGAEKISESRKQVAIGEGAGEVDDLQARLDLLRKD